MSFRKKQQPGYADGELLKELKALRQYGRIGMLESDHWSTRFFPHPLREWTKRELRNRIAWLREQRGKLITKRESLKENDRKLAKYKKELFRRESAANQEKDRQEYNAKRRRKRAKAKRTRLKLLVEKWLAARQASRKALIQQRS